MYGYVWLFMAMIDYVWLCMAMFDYVWLYITIYDYVWLCVRGREKEKERDRAILKTFSSFCKLFQTIKLVQTIQTFSHESNVLKLLILFNNPRLCLPLFTIVYLCPTDASMHKFYACFFQGWLWPCCIGFRVEYGEGMSLTMLGTIQVSGQHKCPWMSAPSASQRTPLLFIVGTFFVKNNSLLSYAENGKVSKHPVQD